MNIRTPLYVRMLVTALMIVVLVEIYVFIDFVKTNRRLPEGEGALWNWTLNLR